MRWLGLSLLLMLSGCEKYYVSVKRETVDRDCLASTFVGSPDPRQKKPPKGQELMIEWRLPESVMDEKFTLVLDVFYKNDSVETFYYPVEKRRGMVTYALLDEKYKEKGGLLTYKAEIRNEKEKIFKQWKQQLWTELIVIE